MANLSKPSWLSAAKWFGKPTWFLLGIAVGFVGKAALGWFL